MALEVNGMICIAVLSATLFVRNLLKVPIFVDFVATKRQLFAKTNLAHHAFHGTIPYYESLETSKLLQKWSKLRRLYFIWNPSFSPCHTLLWDDLCHHLPWIQIIAQNPCRHTEVTCGYFCSKHRNWHQTWIKIWIFCRGEMADNSSQSWDNIWKHGIVMKIILDIDPCNE